MTQFFADPANFSLTLIGMILCGVIYAIRIEGTVRVLRQIMKSNKEISDSKDAALEAKIKELSERQDSVSEKLFEKISSVEKMLHEIIGELKNK